MKLVTDTKRHKFLELANTPRGRLPELIKSSEVDMAYGFSVEELLPSVEYVWGTLRFLLYQWSGAGCRVASGRDLCAAISNTLLYELTKRWSERTICKWLREYLFTASKAAAKEPRAYSSGKDTLP